MKKTMYGVTGILMAILLAAPLAMAQSMDGPPNPGPDMMDDGPDMMEAAPAPGLFPQLNLTKDQIDLLKKEKIKKRKTMIQMHSDLELARVDLHEEVMQENPNMGKIEKLAKKIGDIQGQMTLDRMKAILYFRSILTEEQKQIMDSQQWQFEGMGPGKGMGNQKVMKGKHGKGRR